MATETISIVQHGVSFPQVVRKLIEEAYDWARENPVPKRRDVPARKRALRNVLESAGRHLKGQFFDHQHLIGGTKSFPWDQELREVIATILEIFRQRFFIGRLYRRRKFYCRPEDMLANLLGGLQEAYQTWLTKSIKEKEQEVENGKV